MQPQPKLNIGLFCLLVQVLLWITCLLTSCATLSATPEDVSYIARETVSVLIAFRVSLDCFVDLTGIRLFEPNLPYKPQVYSFR